MPDHTDTDDLRQQSGACIADAVSRQAGLYATLSDRAALFCAETALHHALTSLHEADRALEAISERDTAPDLPTAGFGAAVSLLSKLHGAVRRAQA